MRADDVRALAASDERRNGLFDIVIESRPPVKTP